MTFGAFQGQLRPLVEAAWINHAGLLGVSVRDAAERDSWYRDNLFAACRVASTKQADERQRVALIAYFRHLAPAAAATPARANVEPFLGIRIIGWSPSQHNAFRKLSTAAYAAAKDRDGVDCPLEAWLQVTMQEVFKVPSIEDCKGFWLLGDCTKGFDQAMGTLAVIAADRYWMDRTAEGSEKRLRWQLDRFLVDLAWLEGDPVGWRYVCAIHKNAHHGLPEDVADATVPQLVDVLSMLDTQIRRLCRKYDIRPCMCPTRMAQGTTRDSIDAQLEWKFYHSPTPGYTRGPDGKLLAQEQKGVA